IENYRFSEAGERIYFLLWNDFADWYVETSKTDPNLDVLVHSLETILKLTHPFAPFVTEAIWQNLPWQSQNLITESWPEVGEQYFEKASEFEDIMALIRQIRTISSDLELNKPTLLHNDNQIERNQALIRRLARLEDSKQVKEGRGLGVPGRLKAWLDVDESVIKRYHDKLANRRSETALYLKKLEAQLANKSYLTGAPAALVDQTRGRAKDAKLLLLQLDEQIKASQ
ncbi:MAG TPA: class I tRNA ligase family protein, partial [Candidatus Polarisedimenticolaceae bacterium]|nr:class I tRNA ligase family protein [Candidatus Polarisedimenticolaceae bacterium]